MGRIPDPEGVKAKKAAVRSSRSKAAPAAEAAAPATAGRAPGWLKGEALELWQRKAPQLRASRLLTEVDELTFARYCYNFARWRTIRSQLDRKGYAYDAVTVSGGKLRRVDPLFMVADRLERQLLAVEDRFGMNPAERQRIMAARAVAPQGALPLDDPAAPAADPAQALDDDEPIGLLN